MHRVCMHVWKAIDIHAVSLCLPTSMFVFASNTLMHTQYIDYVHEAICDKCLSKGSANCTMFYISILFFHHFYKHKQSAGTRTIWCSTELRKKLRFSSSNRRSLLLKVVVEHWRASKPAACHHIMSWCQQTNRVELVGQGGKSSSVGGGTPAVSQRIARQTSDLHQTDGVSVALHVWHANCVRRQCGASLFGNVQSCTKQSRFLIRQHFHTTDGPCDLQRLRRSFCLPCASPLLFKRGNMFSLFVSSSGSPRMGEMMRSTGGAEDEGGQAATEMTLADSEMRVKLFCVHKYVTQLPLFF